METSKISMSVKYANYCKTCVSQLVFLSIRELVAGSSIGCIGSRVCATLSSMLHLMLIGLSMIASVAGALRQEYLTATTSSVVSLLHFFKLTILNC